MSLDVEWRSPPWADFTAHGAKTRGAEGPPQGHYFGGKQSRASLLGFPVPTASGQVEAFTCFLPGYPLLRLAGLCRESGASRERNSEKRGLGAGVCAWMREAVKACAETGLRRKCCFSRGLVFQEDGALLGAGAPGSIRPLRVCARGLPPRASPLRQRGCKSGRVGLPRGGWGSFIPVSVGSSSLCETRALRLGAVPCLLCRAGPSSVHICRGNEFSSSGVSERVPCEEITACRLYRAPGGGFPCN